MARPVYQQKVKDKLDICPLFWTGPADKSKILCGKCKDPKEKGKKVTVREVFNYNTFHTCETCRVSVK